MGLTCKCLEAMPLHFLESDLKKTGTSLRPMPGMARSAQGGPLHSAPAADPSRIGDAPPRGRRKLPHGPGSRTWHEAHSLSLSPALSLSLSLFLSLSFFLSQMCLLTRLSELRLHLSLGLAAIEGPVRLLQAQLVHPAEGLPPLHLSVDPEVAHEMRAGHEPSPSHVDRGHGRKVDNIRAVKYK